MGKGRPRSVEKGVLGGPSTSVSTSGSLNIPSGPVYHPTEDEFRDPLDFIDKIRPEAEKYGICKIVPPKSWKPPFCLDLNTFTFPTKTQAIHQLQGRCSSCDPMTFELEYYRFLEEHCGRKTKKKVVFEGYDLDLCRLFNTVKRFGGYDKVVENKKWGEVYRFVCPRGKIRECAKHVLSQLYCEHLCDYEEYYNKLNMAKDKKCKRQITQGKKNSAEVVSTFKRRRKNAEGDSIEKKNPEADERDQICEQCSSGLHGEVMLLCDRCNKGWHIYCLSPPLKQIPLGNWYCLECLNSEKDSFGFVPGKEFSLEAFRRVAERTKKKWFGSGSTSRMQLEKKFWEIVEGSVGKVEVMYGSDLDTSVYGSGFPRLNDEKPSSVESEAWDEYCSSPWNVNNLPKVQGSVLRTVNHEIAGVMVPWLYMGMLFSSFCWHFEDHCFYSMNYLHWGDPKCWYSVPGSEADAFEKVMRSSLPDLFDAQPDLLFQLVTMLNPSVLQENDVPVYSVLQEPGNFIITFPRSYHGGFNLGLNCAEAVNFAPADWLPHGGFGAELYQLYRKPAVLSHEELLCVVAKSEFSSKTSGYLEKELLRMYNKEKTWRERLWKHGIVRSSPLKPKKDPEHVGSEEDPICVICQQFLYLSAVGCHCRPSAFVCLEHWEHLCECKPKKHRLLYRHTLAELYNLVLMTGENNSDDSCKYSQNQLSSSVDMSRKVKGCTISYLKLAEEWLTKSCTILKKPYSPDSYANALKEVEQFLWGGSETNLVRDLEKKLADARNWAEAVKKCCSQVEAWSNQTNKECKKVKMTYINTLLSRDPVPCNVPCHFRLKEYQDEAQMLINEIEQALIMSPITTVSNWKALYAKAANSPIYFKESKELLHKLSSTKRWVRSVKTILDKKSTSAIAAISLYKLKAEISELQIQLPEVEKLLDLVSQVETCRSECSKLLEGPICLKTLESLVREYDGFNVDVSELTILRECHHDAVSWIRRANRVLVNSHCREDQENAVDELTTLLNDGMSLKVEVVELPKIDAELKKARCRIDAAKALSCKMHVDVIKQLIKEATLQQIEKEKVFIKISEVVDSADRWEEQANYLLGIEGEMSDFEDVLRSAEDLMVILPSLEDVKVAVTTAKSWLSKADQFLLPNSLLGRSSSVVLKLENLKELVSESNLLKISLKERDLLQRVLKKCMEFAEDAHSSLCDSSSLLNSDIYCNGIPSCLGVEIKSRILSLESIIDACLSHSFEFPVVANLQDACSTLRWCSIALDFFDVVPTLEEVGAHMDASCSLPIAYASSTLCTLLIDGIGWLKKALEILPTCKGGQTKLNDAEEVLELSQKIGVEFPLMVNRLQNAIEKHNQWRDQVHNFFGLNCHDRSWSSLLNLKDIGTVDAFDCSELDMILTEVKKIEDWKQQCKHTIKATGGDTVLLNVLLEMKSNVEGSVHLFKEPKCHKTCMLCACSFSSTEKQLLVTCSTCDDCFHIHCVEGLREDGCVTASYVCAYCNFVNGGQILRNKNGLLRPGQKINDLSKLIELLSDAEGLCLWIDERRTLKQVVDNAIKWSACLMEITDDVLSYHGENLSIVSQKLIAALKAIDAAGISDNQIKSKFDLALAKNSWKIRAQNLTHGSKKPTIQQIQRHLKEGVAVSIPAEDYFRQQLTETRQTGLNWIETAKKVSMDGGFLKLDKVFELIAAGEDLPVLCDKELKLLKDRSMLYCICRKPYDQRAMIACDRCDEWYHFDCVKLKSVPKVYICPACNWQTGDEDGGFCDTMQSVHERCSNAKVEEPQTPSPGRTEIWRKTGGNTKSKKKETTTLLDVRSSNSIGIEIMMWRKRKRLRRVAKKRENLNTLSMFHVDVVDEENEVVNIID